MKISAKIEVSNRSHASLGSNMRKRPVYSTLSIGKVARNGDFKILYCTKSMATPKTYNIKNNVQQVFTKFIKEGKATIRFKSPPEDIIISHEDGRTLMSFLTILMKVLKNEPINTTHVINPQDTKIPMKPKTSLIVNTVKEYWHEFPRTLTSLMASNIALDDIGNKMRPLLQLKVLDLSNNCLTNLPEYLGNLPLGELNLSHNQLTHQSNWSWMKKPCIQKTLNKLVLSHNKMIKLPTTTYKFYNLIELHLESTNLITMPIWLCTSFPKLRVLDLSMNTLMFLPASVESFKHSLDTFIVPFVHTPHDFPLTSNYTTFPSLKSLAAKFVFPNRFKLTPKTCPESLIIYLFNHINHCKCGRIVYSEDDRLVSGHFKEEALWSDWSNHITHQRMANVGRVNILYQPCVNKTKKCG